MRRLDFEGVAVDDVVDDPISILDRAAARFFKNATTGVGVTLATDRTQDLRDNFNRLLAYVRADENLHGDRTAPYDLGRHMLLGGWATVYVFDDDFRCLESYDDAEADAQDANAGVYAKCRGDFHLPAE